MLLQFECPNGHRLKTDPRHAGKTSRCPRCSAGVTVPKPQSNPITDSGVVRLLGEHQSPTKSSIVTIEQKKSCPRCGNEIATAARICNHCEVYLAPDQSQWHVTLKPASSKRAPSKSSRDSRKR